MILVYVFSSCAPYHLYMVDGIGGQGGNKMAAASTPSAYDPAEDLIFGPHNTAKTNDKSTFLRLNGI